MKIKQFRVAAICMFGLLTLASCSPDWGQADPPAANEIYPELKEVEGSALTFEYDEETVPLSEFDKQVGDLIEVVQDDTLASNVLHLDSACYVRKANPFKGQSLQTGAGITFYVKTAQFDASSPLLTIGGEPNDTLDSFYFTENSQLVFTKGDIHQLQSKNLNVNDPSEVITNAVPGGGWHFVALQLKNDGYVMYVDGVKESEQTFTPERDTQFKYADLIEHLTTAPYLYIGSDKLCEAYFDDIKFYRNVMTDKEWNKTVNGGGAGAESQKVYVPVGADDCSSAFWTEFSDYFTIEPGQTFHTQFINHTNGSGNWNNWNLCVSTAAERGTDGYLEYMVLRADLWGWGTSYDAGTWESEGYGDWDQFRKDMEGALVDLTITREGATVKVVAIATAVNGTVYKETFTTDCGDGNQDINAFFIVDGSYLQIDPEQTYIGEKFGNGSYLVGPADCTAGWWSAFSQAYDFEDGPAENYPFVIHFINNNTGSGANWNNWLLVCTTGGGPGNPEHFVARSDAFGWGAVADAGNLLFEHGFDWDSYVSDMHGAECWLGLSHSGNTVKAVCPQKKADGTFMPLYTITANGITDKVGFFLTAELASLDILDVAYYPYFSLIGAIDE